VHNLLNTAFKFLSRSLVVAFLFLCFFSSTTYAVSGIQFIKANNVENELNVNVSDNYSITWKAQEFAGCVLIREQVGINSTLQWSEGSNFSFSGRVVESDNDVGDVYPYTLSCYPKVTVTDSVGSFSDTYDIGNPYYGNAGGIATGKGIPVSKTVTVTILDGATLTECPANYGEAEKEKCEQVCANYPGQPVCESCRVDPRSPQCLQACTEPGALQCQQNQENLNNSTVQEETGSKCFPKAIGGGGFDFKGCFINILDVTIVSLAASFLQLCAYVFELSIQISIVQFSNLVTGSGTWLNDTWGIVRDVLNIGVIFVLLYAAIKVIVGRGDEIKKLIAGVILFGVMTNFSLFLTKAAVDITNVIALEFYQQMRTVPLSDAAFSGGLGASVVEITGLSNLYDPNPLSGGISDELNAKDPIRDSILFRLAMICVFVAVGLIFLQAAGLFILRTISLILLLIFSPLMFAGAIFSPLQKWIEQWHKEFLGQITVAPIFMIILYVVLTVMGSLVGSVRESLKGEVDMFSFLALTLLTSALIVFGFGAALTQAKKFAGSIGSVGAKWGGKLGGVALSGVTRGGASLTARLGQQTLGRAGLAAENGTGKIAKAAQFLGVNKLKDASFDVRNAPGASKVGSGVSRALSAATGAPVSIDAGAGLGGRETRLAAGVEAEKKKKVVIQTKADTKIEDKFKKIDSDVKKYDITDAKIIDGTTGAELVRTTENDTTWGELVKKANTKEKEIAQTKKSAYLTTLSTNSQATSEKGKAAFRAKKAAEEKLDKTAKATKDHEERKKKLKAFKEDLKRKFASNATGRVNSDPLIDVKITSTIEEIDKMSDEQIISAWDEVAKKIKAESDKYNAVNKAVLENPTGAQNYTSVYAKKQIIASGLEKAKNARQTIESLQSKIKSFEDGN